MCKIASKTGRPLQITGQVHEEAFAGRRPRTLHEGLDLLLGPTGPGSAC